MRGVLLLLAMAIGLQAQARDDDAETVARIKKLGGEAIVDSQLEAGAQVNATFPLATDAILTTVAKMPAVGSITIEDASKITERGFGFLRELPNLQKLKLTRGLLGEKSGAAISNLRHVSELYLGECRTNETTFSQFKKLKELKSLDLFDTRVTDKSLVFLAELPKVTNLNVSGSPITDKGLLELKDTKTLKIVKATRTNITAAGAKALEEAIPGLAVRQ
ncbi:MAG: hypothetical protein ACRC8S_22285 [Fimbriiglobus sp.]